MRLKTKHWLPVLLAALLTPGSALAQRIAVINFEQAVTESAAGRAAGAQLQTFYDEKAAELRDMQTNLEELQQQLATQERVLAPTALAQLNRNIQNAQTALARATEDAEMQMQGKQDELFLPIFEAAQLIFQEYAQTQDYQLIFNTAAPQSGLIYAANTIDITAEITRRLDAAGAAGGAGDGGAETPPPSPPEPAQ